MEKLDGWKRTHTCGELTADKKGLQVILMGWVHRRRDHGGLIFIDLRDRYGLTQIVFDQEIDHDAYQKAKGLRAEFVIAAQGVVEERPEGMKNRNLSTGSVEVSINALKILNPAKTPSFGIDENQEVSEELRLKYRYLDLRSSRMRDNMLIRHRTYQAVRGFFDDNGFIEVETPMLMRSTPEGARDYLVPSRIHHGKFYALPQSPQTYKQILMIAGLDRYYQIVKCFRDEDLRADRQPEFTQIDVEMSFVEREDVLAMVERLMARIFHDVLQLEIAKDIPRLTYVEAMSQYGTDKPDLRFDLRIVDISEDVKASEFRVFRETVQSGGKVCGLCLEGGVKYSRKQIDDLIKHMVNEGAKGLVAIKVSEEGWDSSLVKFFSEQAVYKINEAFHAKAGDLLLLVADQSEKALTLSGTLRTLLAKRENLVPENRFQLAWILDFPLLEFDEDEKRFVARHHPFTSPMDEDLELLTEEPGTVRAKA
ncbi:aspartate--tRNA ligase, partial [bacterium]|nr:aspartate--tRNA ligase [bacterium]